MEEATESLVEHESESDGLSDEGSNDDDYKPQILEALPTSSTPEQVKKTPPARPPPPSRPPPPNVKPAVERPPRPSDRPVPPPSGALLQTVTDNYCR